MTNESTNNYYTENRDAILAKNKKWHDANQEKIKEYRKAYYAKNKETINAKNKERAKNKGYETSESRKEYKRQYYLANKSKIDSDNKAWKVNNKDKIIKIERIGHLRRTYKLTPEQYNQMLVNQNNNCLMCDKPLDLTINNPVDHDHKCCEGGKSCGKCVRGILHDRCNRMLEYIEHYPELIDPAKVYLAKYSKA